MKDFQLSFTTLSECKAKLSDLFVDNPQGKYRVTLTKWTKKRSISINRQQHLWYNQIAKHNGDQLPNDVKSFCKHTFGIPILLNDQVEGEKLEFLLHKLDYYKYSLENQLKLVSCLEITSKLNTAQAKEYNDNVIFYFNDNGINIGYQN
jgi:hypothetical protein